VETQMNRKFWSILWTVLLSGCLSLSASGQSSTTQTAPAKKSSTPGIDQREENQKRRIKRGVKSGELTKHETKKLAKEEKEIRKDEKEAKADGTVTKEERKEIRKEQKKASKDIYKQKHDAQKRPKARKGS
jgi:hypothetical protein